MPDDLSTLEEQIVGGGDRRPVVRRDLLVLLRAVKRILDMLEGWRATAVPKIRGLETWRTETVAPALADHGQRLDAHAAAGQALTGRVTGLEGWRQEAIDPHVVDSAAWRADTVDPALDVALRITVVATVADLPAAASLREWFRVADDSDVYVGNGPGLPLTKIAPQLP